METTQPTTQEWQSRIADNAVYRSMRAVNELAAQIADGRRNSVIVSGPAGIGKTWAFEEAFRVNKIKFRTPRVSSPQALIEALYERPNGTFLFDECDTMLRDVAMLNILKVATDSKLGPRILEWKTRRAESTVPPFEFSGKIVFLLNTDLNKAAKGKLGPHISALMDRCEPFVMTFDHFAIWEYTCYLACAERMLMREQISRDITNQALRFLTETMWRRHSVSPRALTLIAREMKRSPTQWRDLLEPRLLREPISQKPVPPIPQLSELVTKKPDAAHFVERKAETLRKQAVRELQEDRRLDDDRPTSFRAIDLLSAQDKPEPSIAWTRPMDDRIVFMTGDGVGTKVQAEMLTAQHGVAFNEDQIKVRQSKLESQGRIAPRKHAAAPKTPVQKTADQIERMANKTRKPMSKEKAAMNAPIVSLVRVAW